MYSEFMMHGQKNIRKKLWLMIEREFTGQVLVIEIRCEIPGSRRGVYEI